MKKKAVEYSITAKKQDFEVVKVYSSIDSANFARKFCLFAHQVNVC